MVQFPAGASSFSSSEAYPAASYPVGNQILGRGKGKRTVREFDHSLYIITRSLMMELYLHSPIRLHGTVPINCSNIGTTLI